jgi:hypothetical protein
MEDESGCITVIVERVGCSGIAFYTLDCELSRSYPKQSSFIFSPPSLCLHPPPSSFHFPLSDCIQNLEQPSPSHHFHTQPPPNISNSLKADNFQSPSLDSAVR